MKVAWITHHDLTYPGGAEMSDRDLIARCPPEVEVTLHHPNSLGSLAGYDRVVVSRTEYTGQIADRLAELRPVIIPHGQIWDRARNLPLIRSANPLVLHNPMHLSHEESWAGPLDNVLLNPVWLPTADIRPADKQDHALWAHRDIGHKGLAAAKAWARGAGLELRVMTGRPRAEVLKAMSHAHWFVLLAQGLFDPGPRTLIEAALSGCELVTQNAGFWDEPASALRIRVDWADDVFWGAVCSSP